MKNIIYIVVSMLSVMILMSNSLGRGTVSGQGAANAPGDGVTCSNPSCHGTTNFSPMIDISLLKDGEEVLQYEPGETYQLEVAINAQQGTPSRYGFQMTTVTNSDNSQGGVLSNLSNNAKTVTLNSRTYLEHKGTSPTNTFSATWTAPEEGVGQIDIYAAGVAANGNGGTTGDGASFNKLEVSEKITSSVFEENIGEITIYPNPAENFINFGSGWNQNMTYMVYDINGSIVQQGNLKKNYLNVAQLKNGLYLVRILDDKVVYTQKLLKEAF